ncbi:adenylosuccinate synthase [bacterium AH-315-J21]|nr:adenylosuccinate synthase [bacterium AH-315-J21]
MKDNIAVVGLQWGDEGKGKVVDLLATDMDIIARCQGGANAGHTVIVGDKKYVLHLIPSGIIHQEKICYIGNGVVLDPFGLLEELKILDKESIDYKGRLFVSASANLVLPYHKLLDQIYEERRGGAPLGTTLRGIGPAYRDKVARCGIRLSDIFDDKILREKLNDIKTLRAQIFEPYQDDERCDYDAVFDKVCSIREAFAPMLTNVSSEMHRLDAEGKKILFEGAQGALLDVDHGTYPYATSSNTTVGGILTGLGIGPRMVGAVVGVVKAYCTRVGAGPFPTELTEETGELLREKGGEYGATTGRPRRTGWLDLVALQHACRINGVDQLAITKLDVLDSFETIRVCLSYRIDGELVDTFPVDPYALEKVEPVYRDFPGWKTDTSSITRFGHLPQEAQNYIRFIADQTGTEIKLVSTGAARAETILV